MIICIVIYVQPTPEQMQIARIIDTHRIEDPELLKKMKQVQEVTGASEDDASMALHRDRKSVV